MDGKGSEQDVADTDIIARVHIVYNDMLVINIERKNLNLSFKILKGNNAAFYQQHLSSAYQRYQVISNQKLAVLILTNKNNPGAIALVTLGDTGNTPPFHRMMTRFDSYTNECISLFLC